MHRPNLTPGNIKDFNDQRCGSLTGSRDTLYSERCTVIFFRSSRPGTPPSVECVGSCIVLTERPLDHPECAPSQTTEGSYIDSKDPETLSHRYDLMCSWLAVLLSLISSINPGTHASFILLEVRCGLVGRGDLRENWGGAGWLGDVPLDDAASLTGDEVPPSASRAGW